MSQSQYLQVALDAAKKAEAVVLKYFDSGIAFTKKADQTPVTLADQESEQIIIETIKKAFPEHGFYGEESGESQSAAEFVWVIDPIDGTRHFIRGLPFFSTEIALMRGEKCILGVSNAPLLNQLSYAEENFGSYLNDKRVHVSEVDSISEAMLSFGSLRAMVANGTSDQVVKLATAVQGARGWGDAWTASLLARGGVDINVQINLKLWDMAASVAIVEEAGGKVTDIQGNPITRKSNSFLATNGKLHDQVLKFFTE